MNELREIEAYPDGSRWDDRRACVYSVGDRVTVGPGSCVGLYLCDGFEGVYTVAEVMDDGYYGLARAPESAAAGEWNVIISASRMRPVVR